MSDWTPRVIVLGLFALILGLPFVYRPAAATAPANAGRLVIITPHNEQIRQEIERAFSAWHEDEFGQPVVIDWRAMGGTSDIERILASAYGALDDMDRGVGYDLVFGGGDYFFDKTLKHLVRNESILADADLDRAFVADVYPEPTVADKPLYDSADGQWWGVVLSSFGIVYNTDVYDRLLKRPHPTTWSDLTDVSLIGYVGLADPSHSGSVRVTYEAILQRYGWDRGWKTLRRMSANARYFASGASKVPIDVSQGEAAAGVAIDFYARFQAEAVGGDRVGYVSPADSTVVTADPVAILRGANNAELAGRFVRFLLSRRGQSVWSFKSRQAMEAEGVAVPEQYAGPVRFELRRPPVRRDMYDAATLAMMRDTVNPYDLAKPLAPGTPAYFSILPTAMHAMAMDQHEHLREAWRTIGRETDDVTRDRMIELFDELPFTSEQLAGAPGRWKKDPKTKNADRLAWAAFFAERYRQIIEMGSE